MILLAPVLANGQGVWTDAGGFPDDTTFTSAMHGVAVDAESKVWLQPWSASAWIDPATGDSVRDAEGNALFTRALYVYNADGTEAFDPIRTVTVDGVTDTLPSPSSNLRGLRSDHNGDILVFGGSGAGVVWRINHQTGEGMNKMDTGVAAPLSAGGVDDAGNIFVASVIPGNPIAIFDAEFNFLGNAVDSVDGFSRSFEVSGDGNTIFWAGYSNGYVLRYNRPDEFSPFGEPDTLYRGMVSESMDRHPDGHVWMSNAPAAGLFPDSTTFGPDRWLTWFAHEDDPGKVEAFVDSLKYELESPNTTEPEKARGLAFSPDGNTAYAILWDANVDGQEPAQVTVKRFELMDNTAVERDGAGVPTTFELSQNYPNPFNPSTTIKFDLSESGFASLKVYDVYGRLVSTLVNEQMAAGSYSATFDARGLASGSYYYHLEFGGQRLSGTMTLLK